MKHNFLDITEVGEYYVLEENSDILIVPVSYDETSTWIKGSDKGPAAILEAAPQLEFYDLETDTEVYKHGIHTLDTISGFGSAESMIEAVYKEVDGWLRKGKFVVTLGGEHTVCIGPVKAYAGLIDDLSVLQFDAHTDMRPEYNGSIYNHACAMYQVSKYCPVIAVGIRSMGKCELKHINRQNVILASDVYYQKNWKERIIKSLTKNVYISFDLDALDPSIMPSTGTPVPGGLQWFDVLEILKEVSLHSNIVGFDVVELCPSEANKAPDFLAATLIYKLLSYKFANSLQRA